MGLNQVSSSMDHRPPSIHPSICEHLIQRMRCFSSSIPHRNRDWWWTETPVMSFNRGGYNKCDRDRRRSVIRRSQPNGDKSWPNVDTTLALRLLSAAHRLFAVSDGHSDLFQWTFNYNSLSLLRFHCCCWRLGLEINGRPLSQQHHLHHQELTTSAPPQLSSTGGCWNVRGHFKWEHNITFPSSSPTSSCPLPLALWFVVSVIVISKWQLITNISIWSGHDPPHDRFMPLLV